MKEVEFLIVGCGLASIALCEQLQNSGQSFVVFDNSSQHSSSVAAGLYNPVILKRFTPVWEAKTQLGLAIPIYKGIEDKLDITIDYQFEIYRRFASIEEQNLWFSAADKPKLSPYLSLELESNKNPHIDAAFGYGKVKHAGRLDTALLVSAFRKQLSEESKLVTDTFNYEDLEIHENFLLYKSYKCKYIVFAEGYGVKQNPYFQGVPINGTKGEVLTIHCPELKLDYPIKSSVFIIPVGDDFYRVGATYNWKDKTNNPSLEGREELVSKLKSFIKCSFKIVDHKAGIRPTVSDRRPVVGQHHQYPELFILNGLGSRGVMIAPFVAKQLLDLIQNNLPLAPEIDVNRFNY